MKKIIYTFLLLFLASCFFACTQKAPSVITVKEELEDGEWIAFEKEFSLLSSDVKKLRIAADTKYWMYVNGKLVIREGGLKRGPNPTDTYCDEFDKIDNLQRGQNQIVILVQYYKRNSFSHIASLTPGVWFDLKCRFNHLVSDHTWKAMRYTPYYAPKDENERGKKYYRLAGANFGMDASKALDFTKHIDSSLWPSAVEKTLEEAEWGELVARPIPQWRWSEIRSYVSLTRDENKIIASLPYNMQVSPCISLKAKEGRRLKIYTDDYQIGSAYSFKAEYITKHGEQIFEVPIWFNGHKVIYEMEDGIFMQEVGYRESGYDCDIAGSFHSDDPFLDAYWQKAARTLYVSIRDNYMDCPDRERAEWLFDVVVSMGQGSYSMDSRLNLLTRKALRHLIDFSREDGTMYGPVPGCYRAELPCQVLSIVGEYGIWRYYMLSGDKETLQYAYQAIKRYLMQVWKPDTDCLVKHRHGEWNWGDWGVNIDKELLQNCWYQIALRGAEKMARELGHGRDALLFAQMHHTAFTKFQQKYWKGKFYASKEFEKNPDDRCQAMAVLAGMAPKENYENIREWLVNKERYASPAMEKFVLEALCRMGYHEDAIGRLKERFKEMVESPYTTLWEGWEYTGHPSMKYKSGNGTYNHPWSGGGLDILSAEIVGIKPSKPAYKQYTFCPEMASLSKIECQVPTPEGNIQVRLQKTAEGIDIECESPKGIIGNIVLPKGYKTCLIDEEEKFVISEGKHKISLR
ncbi:MAG: glycoside hydrolase [Alistipes sp.]|nr:glycoside hydrolase [Candidatus Alistipes equi]